MSKEKEKKMVPKLRFPEFRDSNYWNVKELGEVTFKVDKRNKGGVKYPIFSINNKNGFVPQSEQFEGVDSNDRGYDISLYKIIERNTFAYNPARINVGSLGYSGELHNIIISSLYVCFKTIDELNDKFLQLFLETDEFNESVKNNVEGGIRNYLFYENFSRINICLPSLPEQQKIASCLSSFDDLITAHSQKLEALKVHKKGLMQQLFPAEGETVPKLRFEEFRKSGEWEEKVLGQLGNVLMCKRIFAEETNESGDIPFYKIGTLGAKPDAYISEEIFNDYKSKYNYPRKGEILITCSGTIGKCLPFDGEDSYYQDSNIVWIDNPTLEICNELLFYWLSNVNWGQLNSTTITRIYGSDLRDLKIRYPRLPAEQQKIASCLSSLDELISAQGQKIEALKAHKKGLMQGLFPDVNGAGN